MLPVYILTGGEVFYNITNAISAFFASSSWAIIIRWSLNIAVISGMIKFIGTKDLTKLIKWVFLYLFILSVLVVPKRSIQIIDLSDPTAHYKVDNVPVGAAILFSFGTRIGFGLAEVYDNFFSAPDAVTYTKTGFLFGANLIRDSLNSNINDPSIKINVNNYVTNCVVGDIMLNHKYSLEDLLKSTDVLELITSNASPIRRTIYKKNNLSCKEAAVQINSDFNEMFRKPDSILSLLNPGLNSSGIKENALRSLLSESYSFFYDSSKSAVNILKSNVTNNAIRQGINSFAGRQDDISGLIMTTSENAQLKARLNWGISSKIATTYLPMLHTVMILLLFGLFPIIILLTVSDTMGVKPLKLYALSLVYLMSWLPLYSILNYVMVFYTKSSLQDIVPNLDNSNRIKIILSDISMIAGYLSLSIPFLSLGLVKGFSAVATNASSFLTSTLSGASSQVSSSAMDGNWSIGNVSTQNVQGFKWDTNYNHASGAMTQQLSTGATRMMSTDGTMGINTSAIQSHLATSGTVSRSYAEQYMRAAKFAENWATSSQDGFNESGRNLFSNLTQLQNALNQGGSYTKGYNQDELASVKKTLTEAFGTIKRYAQQNRVSEEQAVNELNFKSREGHIKGSFGGGISAAGLVHIGAEIGGSASSGSQSNLNHNSAIQDSRDKSNSSELARNWAYAMDKLKSYKLSYNGSETENHNQARINNIGSAYEKAYSSLKSINEAKTVAYNLTQESNKMTSGNATITSNLNNEFVKWLHQNDPAKAEQILSNTSDSGIAMEREQLYQQFIAENTNGRINHLMGNGEMGQAYRNMYDSKSRQIKEESGLKDAYYNSGNIVSQENSVNNQVINDGKKGIQNKNTNLEKDYNLNNGVNQDMLDDYQNKRTNEYNQKAQQHNNAKADAEWIATKELINQGQSGNSASRMTKDVQNEQNKLYNELKEGFNKKDN